MANLSSYQWSGNRPFNTDRGPQPYEPGRHNVDRSYRDTRVTHHRAFEEGRLHDDLAPGRPHEGGVAGRPHELGAPGRPHEGGAPGGPPGRPHEGAHNDRIPGLRAQYKPGYNVREAVLTGGSPWGFSLKGGSEMRSALVISKVESGGKACREGTLSVGDVVISVNNIRTDSRTRAIQLVQSSGPALTVRVER